MSKLRVLLFIGLIAFQQQAGASAMSVASLESCDSDVCVKKAKKFKLFARRGSLDAQMLLASMYYVGYGLKQDTKKTVYWYKKAIRNGNANARYRLGVLYIFGKGIEHDIPEGLKRLKKGANKGDTQSSYLLADLYLNGNKVEKNLVEVEKWLKVGADLDDAASQYRLGLLYEAGLFGTKEISESIALYQQASGKSALARQRLQLFFPEGDQATDYAANFASKGIEHIVITPPSLNEMLDFTLGDIRDMVIYNSSVQTGTRIQGVTCAASHMCTSITSRQDLEDMTR